MIGFRKLERSDLSFLVEVRNDCRAMLHDDREFTVAAAETWFDATCPRFYIITCDAAPIGYFRTSHWDQCNRHVSVGCDLHKNFRGKGLAQMAYPAFLRFLFEELKMNKVSLEVLTHNDRATRLYLRLGFRPEGVRRQEIWRDGRYCDSMMMSMLKDEFNTRHGNQEGADVRDDDAGRATAGRHADMGEE